MFACSAAAIGCVAAPEPPATPRSIVRLSERYDAPTADLNANIVRELLDRHASEATALGALTGLSFMRDVIEEATEPSAVPEQLSIEVQGSLEVRAPCPGWERGDPPDEAEDGFIELTIGVEESRVQRAFSGRAEDCKFLARRGKLREPVMASMELELDLGGTLGLGDPIPPVLMRASDVSSELASAVEALDLSESSDELSLRVGPGDELETLIELETLESGRKRTALLVLRDDGRVGVRGENGEWSCGRDRSDPCVRDD